MGGSEALLRKMLGRFLEQQLGAVKAIIDAFDEGDITEAHRLAHTLKGVAGSICANELFDTMTAPWTSWPSSSSRLLKHGKQV